MVTRLVPRRRSRVGKGRRPYSQSFCGGRPDHGQPTLSDRQSIGAALAERQTTPAFIFCAFKLLFLVPRTLAVVLSSCCCRVSLLLRFLYPGIEIANNHKGYWPPTSGLAVPAPRPPPRTARAGPAAKSRAGRARRRGGRPRRARGAVASMSIRYITTPNPRPRTRAGARSRSRRSRRAGAGRGAACRARTARPRPRTPP